MDTTPHPADASLQASLRHLRRIAAGGALALALLGAAAGLATPAHAAGAGAGKVNMNDRTVAGDPSQWGLTSGKDSEVPVTSSLTRKVNEYEGQHR